MPDSAQVWDEALLANPHAAADKRQRVQRMFAAIATSYDLNNRLHSLWMDQRWRRKAVKLAHLKESDGVVDVE
jgi:demethylmenaquinone methyltransferase/2-methoxy-6-polyprenyl-1,4-benzoquinol methylase